MIYLKIKEVIVVEGKNDTNVLKSFLDCDTIETYGMNIPDSVIQQIKIAQQSRGVIIFTDPDYPGEYIRRKINQAVSNCKNVYIDKKKARTDKKVGVEHATKEDIIEALSHTFTYVENQAESISWDEYLSLGLNGKIDSAEKRKKLGELLHLGQPNAKTLYKRLNMLGLTKEDIIKFL